MSLWCGVSQRHFPCASTCREEENKVSGKRHCPAAQGASLRNTLETSAIKSMQQERKSSITERLHTSLSWTFGDSYTHPTCQCRRHRRPGFAPCVGKIPCWRAWAPTPVVLPGDSHGQRSLVGYSPWSPKELDTTERLSTAQIYQFPFGCYLTNPSYPKFTLTFSS